MPKLTHCLNCQHDLEDHDVFCSHCGQKTHDGRSPLLGILKDFIADQLNLDGKLWRSIRSLLIPGRLTTAYFAGHRKSQINPFKLFFIIAILSFALLSFFAQNPIGKNDLNELNWFANQEQSFKLLDSLTLKLPNDGLRDTLHPGITKENIIAMVREGLDLRSDSIDLNANITVGSIDKRPLIVSVRDFNTLSTDSLMEKYVDRSLVDKMLLRQKVKLFKNPGSWLDFLKNNLVWILAIFIPIIALVLKIIYFRRKRYYVEHLVFSLHLHTVFLIILTISSLLSTVFNGYQMLLFGFGAFSIFLFLSLYRYYQQSLGKTLVKYVILHLIYPFLFSTFAIIALLLSMLFF